MSQLNIDHGMHTYFGGSADEVYYGDVRCEYFAYQDDIMKPSAGVNEAQAGNIKIADMLEEKGLEAHPEKTGFMVFGAKGYKDKINKQLENSPLYMGDIKVKQKVSDRYLGQILHTDGVRASCAATIKSREGKITGATFEIQSIVETFKMQAIGGLMAAWELWERALVPSLLSGAGTWMGITSMEEDKLDRLQDFFWRVMLRVPDSCPKVALRSETKMIGMKYRIWQEKLLLMKRIQNQSLDVLSRKILEEQKSHDWPGLSKEVTTICEQIGLSDINDNDISVTMIKKAVLNHHYEGLKTQIGNSKKMMKHKEDDITDVQSYLKGKSVDNARMAFRIRSEMVKDIRGNFKDKFKRNGGEAALQCQECLFGILETQSHCLICPKWTEIRNGLELDKIEGMVVFFQRLLVERSKEKIGSQGAAQTVS